MNVVLISTYELGRQPFSLSSPAVWLRQAACNVICLDLSVQRLTDYEHVLATADLIAFSLPMHTATMLAAGLISKIKDINPTAHICFYGLYAPVNEPYLRKLGGDTILGGEFEEGLVLLAQRLAAKATGEDLMTNQAQGEPLISLGRQKFLVPDRSDLPQLEKYAQLQIAPGQMKTVGYTEASRGCKHLCRHCPIVPVYNGAFRVVQRDVVIQDIRQQVDRGAQHITFGDPDFFNGPTHGVAIVTALHQEFPELTYDVTIKVEHLIKHREHLPTLRDTGCLFVTSAVEAIDNKVLEIYDKHHTREDFIECVRLMREVGLHMNPTFVIFSPWTSLTSYLDLLNVLVDLDLVDSVAPIQYSIRLLIPASSRLLELDEVQTLVGKFNEKTLAYPWVHSDPAVDRLQQTALHEIKKGQSLGESRRQIFQRIWRAAREAYDDSLSERLRIASLDQAPSRASVPFLTEPWYC
jgi:tRNA A37 methylthiotransferase MiaB